MIRKYGKGMTIGEDSMSEGPAERMDNVSSMEAPSF
jgi:hypothetical protein